MKGISVGMKIKSIIRKSLKHECLLIRSFIIEKTNVTLWNVTETILLSQLLVLYNVRSVNIT